MARALAENGHQVHIFLRDGVSSEIEDEKISIHFFSYKPGKNRFQKVISKIAANSPDLDWELGQSRFIRDKLLFIHKTSGLDIAEFPDYGGLSHECGSVSEFAVIVNFHTPTSIVDHYNNVRVSKKMRDTYKFEFNAWKKADAFRCPGGSLIEEICSRYKINQSLINFIRNPVFTDRFDSISKNHRDDSRIDILFSGRLEHRKGTEILLQNINRILEIDNRIHFTITGENSSGNSKKYREAIEEALNEEYRTRVCFTGSVDQIELCRLYCNSTILFFPSVFENGPYTLYEAMAARLPVIANSCNGVKEVIEHEKNGMVFNHSDSEQLLECIKKLIYNRQFYEKISKSAYDTVKSFFSPEQIAQETIKFYQSVISKKL
jgi:glycosyltransferase involved in cell wall biosynthesis